MVLAPAWNWLGITYLATGACMLSFYKTGYRLKDVDGIFTKQEVQLNDSLGQRYVFQE